MIVLSIFFPTKIHLICLVTIAEIATSSTRDIYAIYLDKTTNEPSFREFSKWIHLEAKAG